MRDARSGVPAVAFIGDGGFFVLGQVFRPPVQFLIVGLSCVALASSLVSNSNLFRLFRRFLSPLA